MKVSTIIFSMLVFSAVLIGAGTFYTDLDSNYSVGADYNMTSYSQQTYISNFADSAEGNVTASEGGLAQISLSDLGFLIFKAPYEILKGFIGSINALTSAFNGLTGMGLPNWVIPSALSFISLIVIIALINAIWKKEI